MRIRLHLADEAGTRSVWVTKVLSKKKKKKRKKNLKDDQGSDPIKSLTLPNLYGPQTTSDAVATLTTQSPG